MLEYGAHDTHECDDCEKEFEWDDSDVIENHEEGTTSWSVDCPHCGERNVVTTF